MNIMRDPFREEAATRRVTFVINIHFAGLKYKLAIFSFPLVYFPFFFFVYRNDTRSAPRNDALRGAM